MNKKDVLANSSFEILPLDVLKTAEYQKGRLNVSRAKAIAQKYDPRKAGAILASKREGDFWILDGQHRVVAAKMSNRTHIMCQIVYGLNYKEEAKYFSTQDQYKRRLGALDKYISELEWEKPESMEIDKIIKSKSLEIARGSGDNRISAIGAVKSIYKRIGPEGLSRCLDLILKTWNGEDASLQKSIMNGVSELIKRYENELIDSIFVKQLKKIDVRDIQRKADSSVYYDDSKRVAYAKVILNYYNKNLRTNKLAWEFI